MNMFIPNPFKYHLQIGRARRGSTAEARKREHEKGTAVASKVAKRQRQ